MSERRARKEYTEQFKKQIVELNLGGKPRRDIITEYGLTPSAFDRWLAQYKNSGSFKEKDNLTAEQSELKKLRKENAQLRMENDILKQAALIMGRK